MDSIKWWPGELAHSASHVLLMAQLYSNGKCYGTQPFFFAIRNWETHELLPGVENGDIGPKLGYGSKGNGFLKFTRFRVPLTSMLSRYISIDSEGKITKRGNPKVMYSSMMKVRTYLLSASQSYMFKAITIATRYSHLRKQFRDSSGNEIPIYDYQLQKQKLFSEISKAYAMCFSTKQVKKLIKQNTENAKNDDFSLLSQAHTILSGYKAQFTWWETRGVVKLMQACGGHGYSHYSGLPVIFTESFPDTILEGENSVLLLQVARSLLKASQQIQSESFDKMDPGLKYLINAEELMDFELGESEEDLLNMDNLVKVFAKISAFHVRDTAMAMFSHISNGINPKEAWDRKMGSRLMRIGQLHTNYSILLNFALSIT